MDPSTASGEKMFNKRGNDASNEERDQYDPRDWSRQRFVLVQPSHPGNVGAAARAIKTMGFNRLILVQPLQIGMHEDAAAIAMASGADDVLAQAQVVEHLDEALIGVSLTIALSARAREFAPRRCDPSEAAQHAARTLQQHHQAEVAWIFGNERFGLPNEIVERCRWLVHIPANPAYSSLNLAQAIQVLAYEARLAYLSCGVAAAAVEDQLQVGFSGEPASDEQIEAMFEHLEQALIQIQFLDPAQPKKLMPRLRRLLARTDLEKEEVNILRGIARAILAAKQSS